jgi:hypothetical protein
MMDHKPDAHEKLKAEVRKDVEEKLAAARYESGEPSTSSSDQTPDEDLQALEAEIRQQVEAEIEGKRQQVQQEADGNDKPANAPKPADKDDAKPVDQDELKTGDKSGGEPADKVAESGDKSGGEPADKGTAIGEKKRTGDSSTGVTRRGARKGAKPAGKGTSFGGGARGKKKPTFNATIAKKLQSATGNKKHAARLLEEKQVIDSHFRKRQMVMYATITMATIGVAIFILQATRNRDNSASEEPRNKNLQLAIVDQPAPPPVDYSQAMEPSPALRALMDEAKELVAVGKFKESIKLFQDHIYDEPVDKLLCERAIGKLIDERDRVDRGSPRWQKVHAQARELILQARDTKDAEKIVQALTLVQTFNKRSGKDRDRAEELLSKLGRKHFEMTGTIPPDLRRGSDPGAAVPREPGDGGAVDDWDLRRGSDPGAAVPREPGDGGAVDDWDLPPRPASDEDWETGTDLDVDE